MTSVLDGVTAIEGVATRPADVLRWLDRLLAAAAAGVDVDGTAPVAGPDLGPLDPGVLESVAVAVALGWEVDARYGQLYGMLQGEPSARAPTVGLVLDLVCSDPAERIDALRRLSPHGDLCAGGLIEIDDAAVDRPLHAQPVRLGSIGRRVLLGRDGLDERLAATATLDHPGGPALTDLPLGVDLFGRLQRLASGLSTGVTRQQVVGADHRLVERAVAATVSSAGLNLLRVDADRTPAQLRDVVRREAEASGAAVHLASAGPLAADWRAVAERLPMVIVSAPGEDRDLTVLGFDVLAVDPPTTAIRRRCWVEAAGTAGIELPRREADRLAASYRLSCSDIADTVRIAATRSGERAVVATPADLRQAASETAGRGVATVARRVEVVHRWDDIVLDDDTGHQLQELCARVRCRETVLDQWGLRRGSTAGGGTHALFSGPSGTGKTAAAQVVAAELGYQMWKVDLASVVSKYIGETEKNLDSIFAAADGSDVVLFFDEADALFGKRSEVRDAHDRYANIEISYLLQRMEEHDGVTVLATNLRRNLDDAFLRRLAFDVRFPFPDEQQRLRIWQRLLPDSVPVGTDVDLAALAGEYPLSGGQIRNAVLAAAFLAADSGGVVGDEQLRAAVRREFQKLGKDIS